MKNYLVTLSYNGARFFGFQRQNDVRSVQAEVEKALGMYFGTETLLHGAGRTDAGVHALRQKINFKSEKPILDLNQFIYALNRLLPADISFLDVKEVPLDFDARHSAVKKIYGYSFLWGKKDPLMNELIAYLPYQQFDTKAFEEALHYFEGEHNFMNFTSKPEDVDHFIRKIDSVSVDINEEDKSGYIRFIGNGFMTYQIRLMMGASFKAGLHKIKPSDISTMLETTPRKIISFNAPSCGLYLEDVLYE